MTIMLNSLREKIRSKTIYIVGAVGTLIITFLIVNADFTFDGRKLVSFEELVPFGIIMVNFLSCILAVMLSIQTIPNEFERKTSHLIMVRGIKHYEYGLGLILSNIIISIISLFILYFSIIIFCVVHNRFDMAPNILGGMGILAVGVSTISGVTSLLSIRVPMFINGLLGIIIYFIGVFHNILSMLAKTIGSIGGKLLNALLFITPDINILQKEAGRLMSGNMIQMSPILSQLLFLYIVITIMLFTFRKEA